MRILVLLLMMTGPVSAQSTANYERLAQALFAHMTAAYMCRFEVGGLSHYQAARSIALGTAGPLLGNAEAVKMIEAMDLKIRNDPRAANPDFGDHGRQACLEIINDGLFEIEAAKVAAGLD